MKFRYLIPRKISKLFATRCQIMKTKNAPNAISAGAPLRDPAGVAYSAPPDSQRCFVCKHPPPAPPSSGVWGGATAEVDFGAF